MKAELVKRKDRWDLYGAGGAKIASSLDWNTKLSIKNCQAIERGYDLDELADEWLDYNGHKWSNNDDTAGDNYGSFKAGFQKALELMGDKKFSEDDIEKAIVHHTYLVYNDGLPKPGDYFDDRINKVIQSLQQTEWDVEVEMEWNPTSKFCDECGSGGTYMDMPCDHSNDCKHWSSKLDADGCLILKRI